LHLEVLEYLKRDPERLKDREPFSYYIQLAHHSEAGGEIEKAYSYYGMAGNIAEQSHLYNEVIRCCSRMIQLCKGSEKKILEPLGRRAEAYLQIERFEDGSKDFQELTDLASKEGDIDTELKGLTGIGRALRRQGNFQESLKYLEEAKKKIHLAKDRSLQGKIFWNLAESTTLMARYEDAFKYIQKARTILEEINDRDGISSLLNIMGLLYHRLADYPKALKSFKEALGIARQIDDRRLTIAILVKLGHVYKNVGEPAKAEELYRKALEMAKGIDSRTWVIACMSGLANIYAEGMNLRKALWHHQEALEMAKEIGDKSAVKGCLNNIGNIYVELGDYQPAIKHYEEALEIAEAIGARATQGYLCNIGVALMLQGNYTESLKFYEKGLKIAEQLGDRNSIAALFTHIANVYLMLGDLDQAQVRCEEAIRISKEIGAKEWLVLALLTKGEIAWEKRITTEAIASCEAALELSREAKDKRIELEALLGLSKSYGVQDYKKAEMLLAEAEEIANQLRSRVRKVKVICFKADLLVEQGKFRQAVEYLEQLRDLEREVIPMHLYLQVLHLSARVALGLEDIKGAREYLAQAESLALKTGHKSILKEVLSLKAKI
jgi:tetratricopeptide (TPR) repeat protein